MNYERKRGLQMRTFKIFCIAVMCLALTGCASWIVRPQKVVLLPEERIFTVPAGQMIKVNLDKKPMEMTFPSDMKLVAPETLVRQEQKLNNEMLKNVKASAERNKILGIIGSVLGLAGTIFGIVFFKKIKWPTFKLNAEVK